MSITNMEADTCEALRNIHNLMQAVQKEIAWLRQMEEQAGDLPVSLLKIQAAEGELRQAQARLAMATQALRAIPIH